MTFRQTYRLGKKILIGVWSFIFIFIAVLGMTEGGRWADRPLKLLFVMAVTWAVPLLIWEILELKAFPGLSRDEEAPADATSGSDPPGPADEQQDDAHQDQ